MTDQAEPCGIGCAALGQTRSTGRALAIAPRTNGVPTVHVGLLIAAGLDKSSEARPERAYEGWQLMLARRIAGRSDWAWRPGGVSKRMILGTGCL